MTCAWQCEIDANARAVLRSHWNTPIIEDVKNVGRNTVEPVDVICGGFPCQDLSVAGKRAGLAGERSGLWGEYARIISEFSPRWVVAENVIGLLSNNNGRDFGTILTDLAALGYDAEWAVLPASAFGAPHERERVFIVAYPNKVNGEAWMGIEQDGEAKIFRERPEKRLDVWLQAPYRSDGIYDGLPSRFYDAAVGAYGNALIPQIAEWIGRRIVEAELCAAR